MDILNAIPFTAWKVSKYGVISGSYFPLFGLNTDRFSPNTGKYGPEITLYLGTFHVVIECEKNVSKYLVFDSTDENKEVLKKYAET